MSEDIKVTDGTVLETLNGKVDIDFDNVPSNSVGFARCSTEVTNCITEIPQRIKYTLENGTLTIKANSVVIVPYGTEDLTAQYPKGATFLHENFKVYDTQFADGKFFVWAEIVEDIIRPSETTSDNKTRMLCLDINGNFFNLLINSGSGAGYTGTSTTFYYNTALNIVQRYDSGSLLDITLSLPIMLVNANDSLFYGSILQVFNGMGYIGSTIWVDKGVKGLIPNGRNEDGSLKNIEYTTPNLLVHTQVDTTDVNRHIIVGNTNMLYLKNYGYDSVNNYVMNSSGGTIYQAFLLAEYLGTANGVMHFQPKQPFKAVDYNQVDGFPVFNLLTLVTSFTESMEQTFDLSDYLPKDNYNYEVFVTGYGNTGATSNNTLSISVSTTLHGNMQVFACRTRTASNVNGGGSCIAYVGADRKITVNNSGHASTGTSYIAIRGYRRVGIGA